MKYLVRERKPIPFGDWGWNDEKMEVFWERHGEFERSSNKEDNE